MATHARERDALDYTPRQLHGVLILLFNRAAAALLSRLPCYPLVRRRAHQTLSRRPIINPERCAPACSATSTDAQVKASFPSFPQLSPRVILYKRRYFRHLLFPFPPSGQSYTCPPINLPSLTLLGTTFINPPHLHAHAVYSFFYLSYKPSSSPPCAPGVPFSSSHPLLILPCVFSPR